MSCGVAPPRKYRKRGEVQAEKAAGGVQFSSKFGKQERENPEDLRIRLQGGQVNLFYCILLSHELHIVV